MRNKHCIWIYFTSFTWQLNEPLLFFSELYSVSRGKTTPWHCLEEQSFAPCHFDNHQVDWYHNQGLGRRFATILWVVSEGGILNQP